jgi:hypothetical protein
MTRQSRSRNLGRQLRTSDIRIAEPEPEPKPVRRHVDVGRTNQRKLAASRAVRNLGDRVLVGSGQAAWWVPRSEFAGVSAANVRERAEAEGWEQFVAEDPVAPGRGPSMNLKLRFERHKKQ